MSRTDKHRPGWVQIQDPFNRGFLEESHDHRSSDCDIHKWKDRPDRGYFWAWSWGQHCYYSESYYGYNSGIFPRQPRRGSRYNRHRIARAQWLRERQRLLAGMDPDEMEACPDSRVYNSWMWERW